MNPSDPSAPPALTEYPPGTAFPGKMGRTRDVSDPAWPAPKRAVDGAPNVLFIVQDDTGFGQMGCYGSPISTPNIDALAANGLVYNNMHTTALCSPTRSCILTGRNHHSNAMSCITEGSTGFPGSNGYIPFENGMLSEILLENGYNTYAIGKWHLTPADQLLVDSIVTKSEPENFPLRALIRDVALSIESASGPVLSPIRSAGTSSTCSTLFSVPPSLSP